MQIVDDVFDNSAVPLLWMPTDPIAMGLYVGSQGTPNTHVSGITIARNTFRNYGDTTVGVFATDSGATADAVAIVDNTFEGNSIPIELGDGSSNGERITGTRIIGNTITGSNTVAGGGAGGINLDTGAVNGTIDQTLIEDNVLSGLKGSILLNAAAAAPGSSGPTPAGDVISNTQIVNNVIHPAGGGIYIEGGNVTSSPSSRVSGVTIENDTLVADQSQPENLYTAIPNAAGASGNQITDVTVRNSILWQPNGSATRRSIPGTSRRTRSRTR